MRLPPAIYFTESLALRLQKSGIRTWFDAQHLEAGSDWSANIAAALHASAAVLVVASRSAFESSYVAAEWRWALANGKPVYVASTEREYVFGQVSSCTLSTTYLGGRYNPASTAGNVILLVVAGLVFVWLRRRELRAWLPAASSKSESATGPVTLSESVQMRLADGWPYLLLGAGIFLVVARS